LKSSASMVSMTGGAALDADLVMLSWPVDYGYTEPCSFKLADQM
jgi:hypothetical protein